MSSHLVLRTLIIALVHILFAVARPVNAQGEGDQVLRYNDTPLRLGASLFKADLTRNPGQKPFEDSPAETPLRPRGSGKLNYRFVASAKDTLTAMGLDARAAYHGFGIKVYAGVNLDDSASRQSQSMNLVLTYDADYGSVEMMGMHPKRTDAALALAKENAKQFFEDYGTHYVKSVVRKSSIAIVFTWSGAGANDQKDLTVQGGGGGYGFSAEAKYQQSFADAVRNNSFTWDMSVTGDDPALRKIATSVVGIVKKLGDSKSSFDAIMTEAQKAIDASFETENPKPRDAVFHIAPLAPMFRDVLKENVALAEPFEAALQDLNYEGLRCIRLQDRIRQEREGRGTVDRDVEDALKGYLAELRAAHQAIKDFARKGNPGVPPQNPSEPELHDEGTGTKVRLFDHPKVFALFKVPSPQQREDALLVKINELSKRIDFEANSVTHRTVPVTIKRGKASDPGSVLHSGTVVLEFGGPIDWVSPAFIDCTNLRYENGGFHQVKDLSIHASNSVIEQSTGKVTVYYRCQLTDGDANTAEGTAHITVIAKLKKK